MYPNYTPRLFLSERLKLGPPKSKWIPTNINFPASLLFEQLPGSSIDEDQVFHETVPLPKPQPHLSHNLGGFPMPNFPVALSPSVAPHAFENPPENLSLGPSNHTPTSRKPIRPTPTLPIPSSPKMADLNLNQNNNTDSRLRLSLKLSTASSDEQSPPATHSLTFQAIPGNFSSSTAGDSIISVAWRIYAEVHASSCKGCKLE